MLHEEKLSEKVIGSAIEVHRALGPGLLESVYEECLCHELELNGIKFRRQVPLSVIYKAVKMECGYRLDLNVKEKKAPKRRISFSLAPHFSAGSAAPLLQKTVSTVFARIEETVETVSRLNVLKPRTEVRG